MATSIPTNMDINMVINTLIIMDTDMDTMKIKILTSHKNNLFFSIASFTFSEIFLLIPPSNALICLIE